jgi:membrane protein DedA with SNARE-associated domain
MTMTFQVARMAQSSQRDQPWGIHRYWHYLFVIAILTMLLSGLTLLNAYYHFVNITSFDVSEVGSWDLQFAGYLGMFLAILILPIPDYDLVPVYGFLCSIGLFDPIVTFWVCLAGAVFPVEYICGRLAARPLLLKGLKYFQITEEDLEVADRWLNEHGRFSIFTATFIPFFYSLASLAAGTLKMRSVPFLLSTAVGFGVRFVFLEYIGFCSIYVFSAAFDYSYRGVFAAILFASTAYVVLHLSRALLRRRSPNYAGPRDRVQTPLALSPFLTT